MHCLKNVEDGALKIIYFKLCALKSFLRGLFGNNLWSKVLSEKYIKGSIANWMRNPNTKLKGTSTVWDGFIKVYNWLAKDLTWYVGNG